MKRMAFQVQAAGVLGGVADLVIGISAPIKIFEMSILGASTGATHITTTKPFFIPYAPILGKLSNQIVDFELSGFQGFYGDLPINFKVYDADGNAAYDLSKLVATRGTTTGGFSRKGFRLRQIPPPNDRAKFWAALLGFFG